MHVKRSATASNVIFWLLCKCLFPYINFITVWREAASKVVNQRKRFAEVPASHYFVRSQEDEAFGTEGHKRWSAISRREHRTYFNAVMSRPESGWCKICNGPTDRNTTSPSSSVTLRSHHTVPSTKARVYRLLQSFGPRFVTHLNGNGHRKFSDWTSEVLTAVITSVSEDGISSIFRVRSCLSLTTKKTIQRHSVNKTHSSGSLNPPKHAILTHIQMLCAKPLLLEHLSSFTRKRDPDVISSLSDRPHKKKKHKTLEAWRTHLTCLLAACLDVSLEIQRAQSAYRQTNKMSPFYRRLCWGSQVGPTLL